MLTALFLISPLACAAVVAFALIRDFKSRHKPGKNGGRQVAIPDPKRTVPPELSHYTMESLLREMNVGFIRCEPPKRSYYTSRSLLIELELQRMRDADH